MENGSRPPVQKGSRPPADGRRLGYIDWARGIAVLLMIEAHTVDAWTRLDARQTTGFRDATGISGINASINLFHRFNQRLFSTVKYEFSRLATRVTPNFANRENVSGEAGISGNNQDPVNWGPPSLAFSSS